MIDSFNVYDEGDKVLVALDCIIFGFDKEGLKILLIRRDFEPEKGKWSLIGGFLKRSENLDDAARRILDHMTGFEDIYLEQLHAFSEIDRDPKDRTISVAFYALINIAEHSNKLNEKYSARWFNVRDIPQLIFDHDQMINEAIKRLRYRASTKPIGFELLSEKFTMRQLRKLYEAIWDRDLDKRNFINKINALDILVKLNEKDKNSSRRGSYLYQFDKEKYDRKVADGFMFKL